MTSPIYSSGITTVTFMMGSINAGLAFLHGVLKCHGTGDLKGHFGRVDLVIRSVVKSDLNVNYRIACKNAGLHSALDTCVDCGDIFLGNNTADDGVDKFIALAGVGLDLDLNVTVLAVTAATDGRYLVSTSAS